MHSPGREGESQSWVVPLHLLSGSLRGNLIVVIGRDGRDGTQDGYLVTSQITSKGRDLPGSSWSSLNSVIIYSLPSCGIVACIPPYMVYSISLFMRPIIPESSVKYRNNSRARGYGALHIIGMSFLVSIMSLALVIGCAILFMLMAGIIDPSRIFGHDSAGQDSQKISNISESSEVYYQGFLDVYRMRKLDGI